MFPALILIAISIGLIEGIPLARKKLWKEFYVVFLLLFIAIIFALAKYFGISTPFDVLEKMFGPIGKFVFDNKK
ncbi:MAG: hypothetical protein CVU84_14235 [Firmicutes bacterium HGW-Firmicutes-1]|nr:MAG: hypothetical protein CVU84_14235 [Firmicutes bacterium HGW-Firmicutes-1]